MSRKPTIAELEDILAKPDGYYEVRTRRDGSLDARAVKIQHRMRDWFIWSALKKIRALVSGW